jgi:carbamoyltransferase
MKLDISKEKSIVGVWGIQDWSGNPSPGWSQYCPTHDHSFGILDKGGNVQCCIELERLTRKKHESHMSKHIENFSHLLPKDFIAVSVNHYAGTSFISENGLWRIESHPFPLSDLIVRTKAFINRKEREAYICSHELAHIGSILPFVGDFKENSLLIHVDGLASESCFSVFQYINGKIKYIYHGWEPLEVVQIFGFNDLTSAMLELDDNHRLATAGRLMGYSSYGKYNKKIRDWLKKNNWYSDHWKNPKQIFKDIKKEFDLDIKEFDLKNKFFMDIAAVCQKEFEDSIYNLILKYQQKTGSTNLYFAGGSALNINLNTRLAFSNIFENVYVPPCCSDTGLALGAISIVQKLRGGKVKKHSPFITSIGVEEKKVIKLKDNLVEEIVDRLYNQEVLGICIGYSESGPRALGHRSILAIPSSLEMYERVNTDIKKREWYRPLAPIIIDELAEMVFPNSTKTELSKYMLCNFNVSKDWRKEIPAVVHIDGSARVQVIYKRDKELEPVYQILKRMWEKYKVPCLINTSFNGPGEPIVHTDDNAICTAKKLGINFVLLDDKIVETAGNEE